MFRLKVTLKPRKKASISTNYRSRLNFLCRELIKFNRNRHVYMIEDKNSDDQFYFSPLFCKNYEVSEDKITFKDEINWYVTCSTYNTVLDLIQGFFCKDIIKIGRAELEVTSMELNNFNKDKSSVCHKKNSVISQMSAATNEERLLMQ